MPAIFTEKNSNNCPIGKMLPASIRAVVGLKQEWMGCWSTRSERQTSPGMALHCSELNPLSVCRILRRAPLPSVTDAKVPLTTVGIWSETVLVIPQCLTVYPRVSDSLSSLSAWLSSLSVRVGDSHAMMCLFGLYTHTHTRVCVCISDIFVSIVFLE